jgi:hypothetical protein
MTTDTTGQPLDAVLAGLGDVIARLDRRRHVLSARLDLSLGDRCWVAQILADPLYRPLVGKGDTTIEALVDLHVQTASIDWRRVRR